MAVNVKIHAKVQKKKHPIQELPGSLTSPSNLAMHEKKACYIIWQKCQDR